MKFARRHGSGFGVTYEGLKLGSGDNSVHAGRDGFGVTYEGLKQENYQQELLRLQLVLELPMRV